MILDYMKTIASFLIFCAFVELLLPSNSFKKYIRVVLGLLTIVIVLKPVLSVLAQNPETVVENMFSVQQSLDEQSLGVEASKADEITAKTILLEYKQNLGNQIEEMIFTKCGIMLISYHILVNEDSTASEYGQVEEIKLVVSQTMEKKIKVDPIQLTGKEKEEELSEQEQEKIEEIKKLISDFYNLSQDNIYISFGR